MSQGYARVTDLEPDMQFRRKRDAGVLTFAYVDPMGIASGKRWVRVTTTEGFQYLTEWDTQVLLAEED